MKWRTDKPTAKLIVAYVKLNSYPFVLHRPDTFYDYYYIDDMGDEIAIQNIEKWADLEEEDRDEKIPLTNADRAEQISQVADILFYNTETGQLSVEKCYELAEKIVTEKGVNLREDETVTDCQYLEEEMSRFIRRYFSIPEYEEDFIAEVDWENSMRECARHFYELGRLNTRKEE